MSKEKVIKAYSQGFDKKVFRVFAEEKVTKVYYQDVIASSTEEVIKIIDGQKDGLAWIEDNEHPEAGAGDFKVFEEQAKPLQREELENSLKFDEFDELNDSWWEMHRNDFFDDNK